ncbi:hypothetical protein V499_01878 [Pseudogymnoascus sp. VKM F-103]|nr:hypothetical protein V499_01878 [Pseudogymnoascus sp. VKM F-103]
MHNMTNDLKVLFSFLLFVIAVSATPRGPKLPFKLPFHTDGSPHIRSAHGDIVRLVGTNWPGHQEAMIPEGLQYSSIKDIVSKIRGLELNVVRLTYATEMVDDIFDNGGDVTLKDTLNNALGTANGTIILNQILKKNPQFSPKTKRLDVFDAVANELASQGIYVHLDNHVSKAIWCCGGSDGNAWFGDTHFDVSKWIRGWKYIARHGAKHWPSLSSISFRNELRKPDGDHGDPYDWYTWYTHMTEAAAAVHSAAPNVLLVFSGLDYDTKISSIIKGLPLTGTSGTSSAGKSVVFQPSNLPYANRIVLELHKYDFENTHATCDDFGNSLYNAGYSSLNTTDPATKYSFPVLLTEWGFIQNGTYWRDTTYNKCLIAFMEKWKPSGWMQWELAGSFYVQTRATTVQDADETWGLLTHDWSAIRSQVTVDESLSKMVDATLR